MDPKNLPPSVLLALGLTLGTQEGCCPPVGPCLSPVEDTDDLRPCLSIARDPDLDSMEPCLKMLPPPDIGPCLGDVPDDTDAGVCLTVVAPPDVGPCLGPSIPEVGPCLEFVPPAELEVPVKPEIPDEMRVCLSVMPCLSEIAPEPPMRPCLSPRREPTPPPPVIPEADGSGDVLPGGLNEAQALLQTPRERVRSEVLRSGVLPADVADRLDEG